jgi:hypothetical protein
MAVSLGCLEYTLEEGERWDRFSDTTICATAWIAGFAGIAFIWRSLKHPQPIVDFTALKIRNFGLGSAPWCSFPSCARSCRRALPRGMLSTRARLRTRTRRNLINGCAG